MRAHLLPWRWIVVILLVSISLVQSGGVFTLQMNDLYSIEFSMEMLSQFFSCLCDRHDQSCSVLLERDLAFTYVTRMVSVSRFPSFSNITQQQIYSKNFVCSIPTSFNDDQMIGCIRLKNAENLCDNMELCESLRLIHGDPCEAGLAGVYWLYPGRIRQNIDNRYVGFSQCSQECENSSSSSSRSAIGSNSMLRTTKITHATSEPPKSTISYSARSSAYSYYSANSRETTTAFRKARTSLNNASRGVNEEGKIVIMITVVVGIVLVILGIVIAGIVVCRKRRKKQSELKSSQLPVVSDPNTTLQFNLTLGGHRGVLNSFSEADGSSLPEFTPDTPPMNSPRDRLIANREAAAQDARGNIGVVNDGFLLDINDNTFVSYANQYSKNDGASSRRIVIQDTCGSSVATLKHDSVSEISSVFENALTTLSSPRESLVYSKVDSSQSDIYYDDYDLSYRVDTAAANNVVSCPVTASHQAAPALYATVGEKTPRTAHAYSRLNETVRVLTNPYNKLTSPREGTDKSRTRLKPYSITRLYSPSTVSIIGDEFYSNEVIRAQFLGNDGEQKPGYVNFKYGTLLENVPASLAGRTPPQTVSSFQPLCGFQLGASLTRPKHIYFELEKDCDVSQRSSLSSDEEKKS